LVKHIILQGELTELMPKVSVDNLNDYRYEMKIDGGKSWLLSLNPYFQVASV